MTPWHSMRRWHQEKAPHAQMMWTMLSCCTATWAPHYLGFPLLWLLIGGHWLRPAA